MQTLGTGEAGLGGEVGRPGERPGQAEWPGAGPGAGDDALERALWARSFLYDDPGAYRDGVSAALAAVRERKLRPAG